MKWILKVGFGIEVEVGMTWGSAQKSWWPRLCYKYEAKYTCPPSEFVALPQVIWMLTPIPNQVPKRYHVIARPWIAKFIAIWLFAIKRASGRTGLKKIVLGVVFRGVSAKDVQKLATPQKSKIFVAFGSQVGVAKLQQIVLKGIRTHMQQKKATNSAS